MTQGAGNILMDRFFDLALSAAVCAAAFVALSAMAIIGIALAHYTPKAKRKRRKRERE